MAKELTSQAQKLRDYVEAARHTPSLDDRLSLLVDLLRSISGRELGDLRMGNGTYTGRAYALLGDLLLAFMWNVHWQRREIEGQLIGYLNDQENNRRGNTNTAIATDGLSFHFYSPLRGEAGKVVGLDCVHGLNLASPLMKPELALRDLGTMLSRA